MIPTVTLSLKEFDELREVESRAQKLIESTKRAALEIEVFLSFLITRENITEYVEEFNRQSTKSQIKIVEGRAKIQLHDNKD
jgi:hypothetical protein